MSLTDRLKLRVRELGLDLAGVAPAVTPEGVLHLRRWLEQGFAGEMHYMSRHESARQHPRYLLDGVRSVVLAAMNYRTAEPRPALVNQGRVSRYAWGEDYHQVLRSRLRRLADFLHLELPGCRTRVVVDTAPLLERDFARRAGIGWIGKNTMLLNKHLGSWLFLGALLTDAELEYDAMHEANHCGTCTRCLDACPTQAFVAPYQLDSRRCISYLTIELRGPVPDELRTGIGNWLFGCDVCQEVCPWNRKAPVTGESGFRPRVEGGHLNLIELLGQTDTELAGRLRGSTMTRAGLSGLRRNAALVLGNSGDARAIPALQTWANSSDAVVRDAARWALQRIADTTANNTNAEPQKNP